MDRRHSILYHDVQLGAFGQCGRINYGKDSWGVRLAPLHVTVDVGVVSLGDGRIKGIRRRGELPGNDAIRGEHSAIGMSVVPVFDDLRLRLGVVAAPLIPRDVGVGAAPQHALHRDRVGYIAPGKSVIMPLPYVGQLMDQGCSTAGHDAERARKVEWIAVAVRADTDNILVD